MNIHSKNCRDQEITEEELNQLESVGFMNWYLNNTMGAVSFCGNEAMRLVKEIRRLHGWKHEHPYERIRRRNEEQYRRLNGPAVRGE